MDMQSEKLDALKAVTEEIIGMSELASYLEKGEKLQHYIGCEISGQVHLGTGLQSGIVIKELQKLGVSTSFFLADWHTWINNKFQGDKEFIERVAKEYFAPALLVSAKIAGADREVIKVLHGSSVYHNNDRYWQTVVDVGKSLTLSRVLKSTAIMGRSESNSMPYAFTLYPPMQVADIYEMGISIAHSGMDQRKVHVIAREVADKITMHPLFDSNGNRMKPVAVHQRLLLGLQKPTTWPITDDSAKEVIRTQMKMSKSIPGSAIFVHDSAEEIQQKIKKAFCPDKEVDLNPILDWTEHLIFPIVGNLTITREERWGGSFTASTFEDIKSRYAQGELSSIDLKNAVAQVLIDILTPARDLFSNKESQALIAQMKEKQSR